MNLTKHIETHLGKIAQGWSTPDDATHRYSVAQFINQPAEGLTTLVSLGISHHKLSTSEKKDVRQEYLMTSFTEQNQSELATFILRFGDQILSWHKAVLRGQVIGPGKALFENSRMNAVYATNAVLLDDSFEVYTGSTPPTVMVWLIPIYDEEAMFIRQSGWEAFEDLLEAQDPDLWDYNRKAISMK